MIDMVDAFEEFLNEFGISATIKYSEPVVLDGEIQVDERGHTQYNITDIDTLVSAKTMIGNEQIVSNGVLQSGDALGNFSLKDFKYLTVNSKVVLHQTLPDGSNADSTFNILKPIIRKSHIETKLKGTEY